MLKAQKWKYTAQQYKQTQMYLTAKQFILMGNKVWFASPTLWSDFLGSAIC